MYKNSLLNKKRPSTSSKQPTFVSQRRNLENIQEKENEAVNNVLVADSQQQGDEDHPKSQDQDDIVIPSSQGQIEEVQLTQSRFLSQRHQFRATQSDIQCRGKNLFEISLISGKVKIGEFGCELTTEGDDPVSFIRRFRAFISNNSENPRKFIDGFKNAFSLNDEDLVKDSQKFLSGLIINELHQSFVSQQTSLIQCFFSVESLRDEISKYLLENLKTYVKAKGEDADPNIIGLVLVQFKFSDQILKSETYNTVYEEFFKILKSTKNEACRASIISCFRDFDELKHDDAVQRLMTLYENELHFLTPFIEVFTEMCISNETKEKVKEVVQYVLDNNCEPDQYPGIVKYLIYYCSDPVDVINNVRQKLKWSTDRQMQGVQSKVLQLLEKSIRPQKSKIVETWLKLIQSFEQENQMKPIDFVVLLMIINIKEEKFPSVKKIFVQNIPKGFFREEFLKKTFKIFPAIIEQYSGSLVELLSALHKITCHDINEFSTNCFKQMFLIEMNDRREIIGTLVQFLCEKTPNLPFSPFSRADYKITTINVLSEIAKDISSAEDLLLNYKILLRVLDISKVKLSFITHRMFVELLCTLAYQLEVNDKRSSFERKKIEEEKERLQEHLEMSMNKLMCNPDMNIKQLGIIGGIKIVSSFVFNNSASSDVNNDKNQKLTFEDLPEGEIRKAAEKISFIFNSVNKDPLGLAMIYDELSLEFAPKRCKMDYVLNEIFLQWINELLSDHFQPIIGTEHKNSQLPEGLGLSRQLSVDEPSDGFDFAVKFGLHVYDEKANHIIFIPALFKTLRIIEQQTRGELDSLREYSLMPLILTENFASNDEEISCCDLNEVKMKLDLYFHCINWLREIISAFSHWSEENEQTQKKVVKKRLKQLIKVEEILTNLLREVPLSYYPPPATFLDIDIVKKNFDTFRKEVKTVAKSAPAKKKKKQNDATAVDVIDETVSNQSNEMSIRSTSKLHQFCREIDPHFIILLNEKYEFESDELPDDKFGLRELNFMLEYALSKISVICNPRNAEQKGLYDPITIITEMKDSILISLVKIFTQIRDELIEMNMKVADDGNEQIFYTKDSNLLKNCFELILGIFDEIFSCPRLRWDKNKSLLVDTLKILVSENELPRDVQAIDQICLTIIESYESFQNYVRSCDTAFLLVKLLTTVSKLSGSETQCSTVTDMCKNFLGRTWKNSQGDEDHGSTVTNHLAKLLEIYIDEVDLDQLMVLVNEVQEEISKFSDKKVKHLKNFPSFTRQNSSVIVRVYLSKLTKLISSAKSSSMNYNFWLKSSEIMTQMQKVVKQFDSQNAYVSYIKNFVIFFKIYNIHGIAVLKKLTEDAEKFKKLVKVILNLTREAHGIANEFKSRKNKSIRSLVPTLRQLFEKNTQLTKPLLNKAGIRNEELHFGPMQNYDTNKKPIASQTTSTSGSDMEDDTDDNIVGSPNVSDDETDEDLQEITEPPPKQRRAGSARKRSTIL